MNNYGIVGSPAPEFRFDTWLAGVDSESLRIKDITEPIIYLYNFQSWCPGCHSHGFPTMKQIKEHFERTGQSHLVKFVAVQTVFEGHDTNTGEAAIESLQRHGLTDIALGHDSGHPPTIMADYRTGGTPWSVLIGPGPDRRVLADGFHVDPDAVIGFIEDLLRETQQDINQASETNQHSETESESNMPTNKDDLRSRLTAQQYEVTQNGGTERAFTGEYWDTKTPGTYRCVVCDTPLFDSDTKFNSGTGWPSFHSEIDSGKVTRITDRSHGMVRTEARCAGCDAHLGHIFPDGPRPTGERYCINSASLKLEPSKS